ncbi:MAG: hypothetical protein H6R15_3188 [Proteobacteria bacterium]|nr:hypothetical protein [Pseudomonadota bacterium]
MLAILTGLALLALAGLAWLIGDGLYAIVRRRRSAAARRPRRLQVISRREVGDELLCLELADPRRRQLPAFAAGQHVLLTAPTGQNGQPIRRAYSLAAWTARPERYELGIKREAQGAMTQWLWQHLQVGDSIEVSPAQGDFVIAPGTTPLVLIAGGIGITPLRAMAQAALGSGRAILLFQQARRSDGLLYHDEFATLAAKHANFHYLPRLSRPAADWAGETGRLDAQRVLAELSTAPPAEFYLCAGNAMLGSLEHGLLAQGIAKRQIHREVFSAGTESGQIGLNLTVDRPGTSKTVISAGEPTVLATLEANAIAVSAECRAGSCGQCVATLHHGAIDWLVEPEFKVGPRQFLPCVCAARSDLGLGLA